MEIQGVEESRLRERDGVIRKASVYSDSLHRFRTIGGRKYRGWDNRPTRLTGK